MAVRLSREELPASIVVGFSRFGSYAIAKAGNRVTVLPSLEMEEVCSRKVLLQHLRINPSLLDRLEKLGMHTVGDFLDLPQGGIARHLGQEASTLYRLAAGELSMPLQPRMIPEPLRVRAELEEPESNAARLLFRIKQLLDPLLMAAADRSQKVSVLRLQLLLEDGDRRLEQIQPARPTLKVSVLLDLVRLRLESLSLPVPPVELVLEVEGVSASPQVLSLLQRNPRRNLEAALRALARIRAEFGPDSVLSARLKSGHLPEARSEWRPLEKLKAASPRSVSLRPLVRRAHARPLHIAGIDDLDRRHQRAYRIAHRLAGEWRRGGGQVAVHAERELAFDADTEQARDIDPGRAGEDPARDQPARRRLGHAHLALDGAVGERHLVARRRADHGDQTVLNGVGLVRVSRAAG